MIEKNIDKREELIKEYVEHKTVLDLGPGDISSGRFLHKFLDKQAKSCLGLELNEERAKNLIEKGYDVNIGDAQNFSLNRKFDVIVAGDLIEHLTNFEGFFNSVKKHLKAEGKLIINTPNAFSFYVLTGINRPAFHEHTCWFDHVTLTQLVERFDMNISQSFCYTNSYGTVKGALMQQLFRIKPDWHTNILVIIEP